jgi:hypothetical protein
VQRYGTACAYSVMASIMQSAMLSAGRESARKHLRVQREAPCAAEGACQAQKQALRKHDLMRTETGGVREGAHCEDGTQAKRGLDVRAEAAEPSRQIRHQMRVLLPYGIEQSTEQWRQHLHAGTRSLGRLCWRMCE